ncbi:MAG: glycosyltransferase family 2 protein [Lachnospiraceae bacterium]
MIVDVIIVTYKPDKSFFELINKLNRQTVKPNKIMVINTEEIYFSQLVYGSNFLQFHSNVQVSHISSMEFDHGRTREKGIMASHADIVVCMTQDAMPQDEFLIQELIKPLEDETVAVSYARQLPREDCGMVEAYTRGYNYPDKEQRKTKANIPNLGIKTYFCSDVCAAYNRKTFLALGGFISNTIFNEDMIYAAKAIEAEYAVHYAAKAKVYHSHEYSFMQQLRRNFDMGVSQADHPEVFVHISSEKEGISMILNSFKYFCDHGNPFQFLKMIYLSGAKFTGYFWGKRYQKLSKNMILYFTSNKNYWKNIERKHAIEGIDVKSGYGRSNQEQEMRNNKR